MRTFEGAIACLNGRREAAKSNLDDMRGSDDMLNWLALLGHSVETLDSLNAIHISGTKGKGSTCTFVASFLAARGRRTGFPRKIGLYTSPHMSSIRERIRINGEPIPETLFASCFFEIWERLPKQATSELDIPRYLQLLALLSFHVFIREQVDVAIFETHCGGEFDATNVIRTPVVTAITSIGMDHVKLLGPTIQDISWHKGGIFKSGCLAFSSPQEPDVATELMKRADEKQVALKFVDVDPTLPSTMPALQPMPQRINCSLAQAVAHAWLLQKAPKEENNRDDVISGIEHFSWPGRFQQIHRENCQWFLDCAHDELSLPHAVKWFAETVKEHENDETLPTRILIFSHLSKRDGVALLKSIAEPLQRNNIQMQRLVLTTNKIRRDGQVAIDRNMTNSLMPDVLERDAKAWRILEPTTIISVAQTIEDALYLVKTIADQNNGVQALITGSTHLVSGALSLLESSHSILGQ